MDFTVFFIVLFLLLGFCTYAGRQASKNLVDQEDYFLAGKGVSFFPLMMTLVATQVGGGLVLGSAEEAYRYGWSVVLYPLGASLGFLFLASGIGRRMAEFKVSTVAQLFEVVYRSPGLKKMASLLSIVSLFMIFVAQVIASKKFMLSLGMEGELFFIAFWALVVLYTVVGGLRAVVAIDIIQALFFIAIFFGCAAYVIGSNSISFNAVLASSTSFDLDTTKLTGWLLMPLLFMVIEQDMGQRCFAAKSGKVVSWACGCAAVCTIAVCVIPVYLGVLGKLAGISAAPGASILMTVVQSATNPILAAFVGCAILAAIISTADSLVNAISSNLAQDFDLRFLQKEKSVFAAQAITAGIAIAGIFGSYYFNNVVDMLIQSYELSVSCLFVPVFAALFRKEGYRASAMLAIFGGTLGFIVFRIYPIDFPREIASLAVSGAFFWAAELWFARSKASVAYNGSQ
jgi:SSS family solute:Na+ symporter